MTERVGAVLLKHPWIAVAVAGAVLAEAVMLFHDALSLYENVTGAAQLAASEALGGLRLN